VNFEDQEQKRRERDDLLHGRGTKRTGETFSPIADEEEFRQNRPSCDAVESSPNLDHEEMALLGRVKVDLDTPLEKGLSFAMWALLFGAYMCFHIGVFGGKRSPPSPEFLTGLPYFLGFAALAFALRRGTDNYYLLDIRARQVKYHFRFLNWESVETAFRFDDILWVEYRIETRRHKSNTWNEHQLRVHRSIGEDVEFSNWERDGDNLRSLGQKLAKLFQRPLKTADLSELSENPKSDGSNVLFHVGETPVTEHRLAITIGLLFLLTVIGIIVLSALL